MASVTALVLAGQERRRADREQRQRDAAKIVALKTIFGRALDQVEHLLTRLSQGDPPSRIASQIHAIGSFQTLARAAEAISLFDLPHPKAVDVLLCGRNMLNSCILLLTRLMANEPAPEIISNFEQLKDAVKSLQGELDRLNRPPV